LWGEDLWHCQFEFKNATSLSFLVFDIQIEISRTMTLSMREAFDVFPSRGFYVHYLFSLTASDHMNLLWLIRR
jgi:hypothetical protein